MRKFHNILLFLTACVLLSVSCYEDKSKLQSLDIPEVTITVPEAIAQNLSVVHGKVLSVEGVQVSRGGELNPQGLTYEWTVSETKNDPEIQLLATTKDFKEKIDLPINSNGYLFVLNVKDALYDTKYQYQWRLYVTAQYGEGVVVAYTKDGTSGDLGLIMHPKLTKQFTGTGTDPEIHKDLIKSRNGNALPQPITHLVYNFVSGTYQNILWVSTKDDLMRIETDYYEILGHKDDIFVYVPDGVDIESIRNTFQCTLFINKGKIYESVRSWTQISAPISGDMKVDRNVISAHTAGAYARQPSSIFYDAVKGKFCYGRNTTFKESNSTTGAFPTGNLSSKRSKAGGISIDGTTHCMLMEDIASGNHTIYTFTNTSSLNDLPGKYMYDLPATVNDYINNASALFFSEKEPILYIARDDKMYVLIFESGAVSFDPSKPVFTAPAGETITMARLYMQGYYAAENWHGNATLEWNSRAVIVVTSKGDNNDKIHVVPQINFGSGMLDQSQAIVCDGFGKITDFTVAGLAK